jgi:hypothetical protein
MSEIVVTDEQAKAILAAEELLPVKDQVGNVIAYISPPVKPVDVKHVEGLLERRRAEAGHKFEDVLDHLRQLGQNQLDGRNNAQRRLNADQSPGSESDEP